MQGNNRGNHYKYGFIYYNPSGPSFLVPKRNKLGFTLNFAHKWAMVTLFILIIVAIWIAKPTIIAID